MTGQGDVAGRLVETAARLRGHTLIGEGAPHDGGGVRINIYHPMWVPHRSGPRLGCVGASNRGDVRPRVACPWCGRSTAVTFDALGGIFLRSHNDVRDRALNARCVGSGRDVRRHLFETRVAR